MDEMLELKQEFFSEAFELISQMEEGILKLENDPHSSESINAIFRVAHTIKGGAASLEMERITVFTHNLENLLDLVRENKADVDEDLVNILLSSLDILQVLLKAETENRVAQAGIETQTLELIKNKIELATNPQPTPKAPSSSSVNDGPPPQPKATPPPVMETSIEEEFESDLGDENFKDILLDEFSIGATENAKIQEEMAKSNHLFLIHVRLDDENEMRSVSGIQTITAVRGLGTLVSAAPSIPEIMETEFIEHLQFLLLSKESQDKIFGKIYISDVTKEVEVSDISTMFGKIIEEEQHKPNNFEGDENNPLDIIPEQDFESHHQSIEEALKKGDNVFNVRVLIKEDTAVRNVDSLLVITSLEEIGEVLATIPSKRELQTDEYFPVIDVLLETKESREKVKEKVFIPGATLEIRVSEFRLKVSESGVTKENVLSDSPPLKETPSATPSQSSNSESEVRKEVPLSEVSSATKEPISPNPSEVKEEVPVSVPEKKIETYSDLMLDRLTSKEEARVRGLKSVESGIAQKTFLKVESSRVDRLLNLVSELVISKAALTELSNLYLSEIGELKITMNDTQDILVDMASKLSESDQENLKKLSYYLMGVAKSWRSIDVFETTISRVSRSINELQEGITQIRMVPIGNVFNRFPRMIRDLSRQLQKKIRLDIYGEDTELDKSVIEELADPLMHMIRNSVDHGVEMPADRLAKGKSEEGTIILKAVHEGTNIRIEIIDDGAGLDPQKLLSKAISKGLVSAGQNFSTEEIYQFILLPGFSTAEKITDLSGRGVGMDVVRRNIEELSGKLSIESELGKGSKFIIKIPLTLSIIQALVFKVKGFSYAIPLSVISETVPLKTEDTKLFEQSEVMSLGGDLISVVNVAKVFNIKEERRASSQSFIEEDHTSVNTELLDESLRILERIKFRDTERKEDNFFSLDMSEMDDQLNIENDKDSKYLIVVNVNNKRVGLLVDTIVSEQDIVIKPLDKRYASSWGLSGATILGDGSISLIIDVSQIVDIYLNKDKTVTL